MPFIPANQRSRGARVTLWCAAVISASACVIAVGGALGQGATDGEWSTQLSTDIDPLLAPGIEVRAASLSGTAQLTKFEIALTKGVTASVATLGSPYRVVIDLPRVAFQLPPETGTRGQGLIKAYRFGLFAEDKARIVIDTTGPVAVTSADMVSDAGGPGVRLRLALAPMSADDFGAGTGAAQGAPLDTPPDAPVAPEEKQAARQKPIIVIDPGHGGIDPGASGVSSILEKNVVLDVGRRVGSALAATGRYDVRFTRSTDVFVSLADRVKLSRTLSADLFISLHADAIGQKQLAHSVRGASVYTLSDKASNEEARLRAERENASDLLAGIDAGAAEGQGEVMSILFDLLRRETAEFSADFAGLLTRKLGGGITMARDPQRSAAFKVLKQPHAPSILLELGYMSNAEDEKLMTSTEWQGKVVAAITAAVEAYFSKRTAGRK